MSKTEFVVFMAVIIVILIFAILGSIMFKDTFSQLYKDEPKQSGYLVERVTEVLDGDTIILENGDKIRLSVVNTPERGHEGWETAREWTEYKCLGKQAVVDIDDGQPREKYNRLVGAVYCDGDQYINLQLLELGLGVIDPRACLVSEFAEELCSVKPL